MVAGTNREGKHYCTPHRNLIENLLHHLMLRITVWQNGLWLKLWEHGVQGKMWRVIKGMYESSRSAVLLMGRSRKCLMWSKGLLKDV